MKRYRLFSPLLILLVTAAVTMTSAQDEPELSMLQDPLGSPTASRSAPVLLNAPASPRGSGPSAGVPKSIRDYNLPGLDQKINLTTTDPWEIVQLIEFLAHRGGVKNIVIGSGVAGMTTKLRFEDVAIADALEVVLFVNRLAYDIRSDILTIITDTEYKSRHGVSFFDQKQVSVEELKYADPARVASMLGPVKSDIGMLVSDPVTGTLILIDTPSKIAEMREIIAKADIATVERVLPTETRSFNLQYADVNDIQGEVQSLLSADIGSLRVDKRTQTMIVTELPHTMRKVENLIELFDRRPKQVFIEAKIVEVTLADDFSMGIKWDYVFEGANLGHTWNLAASGMPGLPSKPAGSLTYNTVLADGSLDVVLEALEKIGDTEIRSNPHVVVMDGQSATIEVIDDQPYKEIELETGTTNVTGVTYLFKKVGVQLQVTPRINDEDIISVVVRPEISSISQWYDGAPQEGTPVIRKALAETTLMVKDGVTIIIGGMIQARKDTSKSQIPLLGSIPLLGQLFRFDSSSKVNTETVVFMTPRIVTGDTPVVHARAVNKKLKPMRLR